MEPSDSRLQAPNEYEEQLERARHIEDPLQQHNRAIELLNSAERDRRTASDPQYDEVIKKLQTLEKHSGERLARNNG